MINELPEEQKRTAGRQPSLLTGAQPPLLPQGPVSFSLQERESG
jgi:hypothetical protein